MKQLIRLGQYGITICTQLGCAFLFLLRILKSKMRWRVAYLSFMQQIYALGILSLIIIVLSALFIGMVVSVQGYYILNQFGATEALGELLALSVLRELGPVIAALLYVGRACSSVTAEIGLMRATQQLDCMDVMAVDPVARIVLPRFWSGILVLPLLTLIFNTTAIYGGFLMSMWLGVDHGTFWSNMQASVHFPQDITQGIIKSIVFAGIAMWIAVYKGFFAQANARGVSEATTQTVICASLMIFFLDFILTSLMMQGA